MHYLYRIYRRQEGSRQQTVVADIAARDARNLTLTDSGIEWEKTYEYHAETVTAIARENKPAVQVEGDETPEIKVFADDIFPPAVPSGLQAVASGPGQTTFIDLVWAPVTDVDLDGYNVYRHEEGSAPVKINADAGEDAGLPGRERRLRKELLLFCLCGGRARERECAVGGSQRIGAVRTGASQRERQAACALSCGSAPGARGSPCEPELAGDCRPSRR